MKGEDNGYNGFKKSELLAKNTLWTGLFGNSEDIEYMCDDEYTEEAT